MNCERKFLDIVTENGLVTLPPRPVPLTLYFSVKALGNPEIKNISF